MSDNERSVGRGRRILALLHNVRRDKSVGAASASPTAMLMGTETETGMPILILINSEIIFTYTNFVVNGVSF